MLIQPRADFGRFEDDIRLGPHDQLQAELLEYYWVRRKSLQIEMFNESFRRAQSGFLGREPLRARPRAHDGKRLPRGVGSKQHRMGGIQFPMLVRDLPGRQPLCANAEGAVRQGMQDLPAPVYGYVCSNSVLERIFFQFLIFQTFLRIVFNFSTNIL